MIFDFFTAFSLELAAVILAAAFLLWLEGLNCGCKRSSKILGYVILILALGSTLCTAYHAYRYSRAGAFLPPRKAPGLQMQMDSMNIGPTMSPGMMNPMMQHMYKHKQGGPQGMPQSGGPGVSSPLPSTHGEMGTMSPQPSPSNSPDRAAPPKGP